MRGAFVRTDTGAGACGAYTAGGIGVGYGGTFDVIVVIAGMGYNFIVWILPQVIQVPSRFPKQE